MLSEGAFMSEETNQQTENPAEDSERVSRLATPPVEPSLPRTETTAGDDEGERVVNEYEQRYRADSEKPKRREMPRSYSTLRVTDEEKLWAAVAHASVWLTLVGGLLSLGTIVPVSVFVPLAIYFVFRRRSDYVAFHALQAFVLQLIGTVGALALLLVGGLVWTLGMVIAVMAVAILIGFILVPLWGVVGVALGALILVMPIATLLYGTIGALETYNGRDYRYPFIARWVDRQLAGGYLQSA
jgi:uncharacterized Tic20 family protein